MKCRWKMFSRNQYKIVETNGKIEVNKNYWHHLK